MPVRPTLRRPEDCKRARRTRVAFGLAAACACACAGLAGAQAPSEPAAPPATASTANANSPASLALPAPLSVRISACEQAGFDLPAFEHALSVELAAEGALAAPQTPADEMSAELAVELPGCAETLELALSARGARATHTLHSGDYAGVGQPRGLALATVEQLRLLWSQLATAAPTINAPTTQQQPLQASAPPEPAQPTPKAPSAHAASRSPLLRAGAGLGSFGAPHLEGWLSFERPLTDRLGARAQLGYGFARKQRGGGALTAHGVLATAALPIELLPNGPVQLAAAPALSLGIAWARGRYALPDVERIATDDAEPAGASEPVRLRGTGGAEAVIALASLELSAALQLAGPVLLGVWARPSYALLGVRFVGATALDSGTAARIELVGFGLSTGLFVGVRLD